MDDRIHDGFIKSSKICLQDYRDLASLDKICNDIFWVFVFFVLVQYQLQRGAIHACHAGGVVHLLEGWSHHEVGAIDVDRIDVVWNAALKHGLKLL